MPNAAEQLRLTVAAHNATLAMNIRRFFTGALIAAAIISAGCSREESKTQAGSTSDYRAIALEFAKSLSERQYTKAYEMTTGEYRRRISVEQLQASFESIVSGDWGPMGPIEVGETMTTWPDKKPADLGWVYVSIGGDVYSEAVIVIVTSEDGVAKVREVEFGRP